MTYFQSFGIAVVGLLIVYSLANLIRNRGRSRVTYLWLSIWIFSIVALVHPSLAVTAARAMGVGRGADLIFYVNVLGTLTGFFLIYLRQRKIDRQITVLVREIALITGPANKNINQLSSESSRLDDGDYL
jgi:small membrane protein